jgi:hypothetical protein
MKEAPSALVSVYTPITNLYNKEKGRKRKRDRLISGCFTGGIVVVSRCNTMRKRIRERGRERKSRTRETQLYLLQFIISKSRVLIPINCSAYEI